MTWVNSANEHLSNCTVWWVGYLVGFILCHVYPEATRTRPWAEVITCFWDRNSLGACFQAHLKTLKPATWNKVTYNQTRLFSLKTEFEATFQKVLMPKCSSYLTLSFLWFDFLTKPIITLDHPLEHSSSSNANKKVFFSKPPSLSLILRWNNLQKIKYFID